jgi:hypothetical protein
MTRDIRTHVDEERLKTISDKVKAHEMQLAVTQELYKVVVTGDIIKGEPGMLENSRSMSRSMERIEQKLSNYAELDRRVREIEERHVRLDRENEFKKKELSTYKYYFITLGVSNFVTILWLWIKP